jgi:hypothetical protein
MSDITKPSSEFNEGLDAADSVIQNANDLVDYIKDANAGEATISDAENLMRDSLLNLIDEKCTGSE